MTTCQICGKELGKMTYRHLELHNITCAEYNKKYKNQIQETKIEELSDLNFSDNFEIKSLSKNIHIRNIEDPALNGKYQIIDYLSAICNNKVENNFIVQIKDIKTKSIIFEIVTDIAIPKLKIDFEFPKAYWHNSQPYYSDITRTETLKSYGWKIINTTEINPSVVLIENLLKKYNILFH